jgi:exonuclease SbcC
MILKSIRLKNIRSYTEQQIDLPEGAILLAGDIGSGKSSILHAVEFALFGARRDSISGEALLRKGERQGEVEIRFELDGKDIIVKRTLKRQQDAVAQDSGYIAVDGIRTEGTATELKARILDMLGYPRELLTKSKSLIYRYTVYTPQEEMKQVIFDDNEARIDTLRKVFGIDRYKRVSENALIYVRQIKEGKKELLGMMQGIDEKRSEMEKRKQELEAAMRKREELMPLLEEARRKKAAKKSEINSVEKKITELHDFRKKSEVCDVKLAEMARQKMKDVNELAENDTEIAKLKRKLETIFLDEKEYPPAEQLDKEIASLEMEASALASRKAELAERDRQIQRRILELGSEIHAKSAKTAVSAEKEALYRQLLEEAKDKETMTRLLGEISSRLKAAEITISELNSNKRNSETLKRQMSEMKTCPTCKQDVPETHRHAIIDEEERKTRKITSELEQLVAEKESIAKTLEEHNKKLERLAEKERSLAGMKVELSNIASLREELEQVRKIHANLDQERSGIMSMLAQLDDKLIEKIRHEAEGKKALLKEMNSYNLQLKEKKHNLQMLAEKEQRKEGISKHQEQLKLEAARIDEEKRHIGEEIFKRGALEEFYKREKSELDRILDEEKRLEVRNGEISKEIEGVSRLIATLERDIKEKEKAQERLEHLNSVQQWLEEMFVNLMATMEKQIMAKVHGQFSELFSTWFGLLIEDANITARIDDSFTPVVMQNSYDTDILHLSGGEKTSIALAYRLALNKVINDIVSSIKTKDILILDEPTDGFSSEQLDKVRNVLDELNVKQTIIVSHESKIESFVDHVIRIHKSEHVSRVVSG